MPRKSLIQDCEEVTLKNCPISGKAFYLDLPDNKSTKLLEDIVKNMGGVCIIFYVLELPLTIIVSFFMFCNILISLTKSF